MEACPNMIFKGEICGTNHGTSVTQSVFIRHRKGKGSARYVGKSRAGTHKELKDKARGRAGQTALALAN